MKSLCRACGEIFTSVAAFDKHRTGDHAIARRCLTKEEMQQNGMVMNRKGWWAGSANPKWRAA